MASYILIGDVCARYHCAEPCIYEKTQKAAIERSKAIPHIKRAGIKHLLFREDWLDEWDEGAELEHRAMPDGGRIVRPKETQ